MKIIQKVRGTSDLIGSEYQLYRKLDDICFEVAKLYGCIGMETPIIEFAELFCRPLGEDSDIVSKEMYTFDDRSDNKLTLRPELTSGIVRAYLNSKQLAQKKTRIYVSGPVFRYERPQKGRARQFYQAGIEFIGESNYSADFDAISLAYDFLSRVTLTDNIYLEVNSLGDHESRSLYRKELVAYFTKNKKHLSDDSLVRLDKNPLRILDSKADDDQELIKEAPNYQNYLNETSQSFFKNLLSLLDSSGIKYEVNPKLVRGLDYYNHTVFEFKSKDLGAQSTILAGGRYDYLAKMLGSNIKPAVGWSAGIDRIALISNLMSLENNKNSKIAIYQQEESEKTKYKAFELASKLRKLNYTCCVETEGKLKKLLPKFVDNGYKTLILLSGDNLDSIIYKDLESQNQISLSYDQLIDKLKTS